MDIYEKITAFYQEASTEKSVVGQSSFGRNLYAVKVGEGKPVGLAQYAIHGREYATAELAIAHYRRGIYKGSLWILPLVNPDGCLLSQVGLESVPNEETKKKLLAWNRESDDFRLWKANGRGVDLNVNFPARWGRGANNTRTEGSENYIGKNPFSESETLALKRFTEKTKPDYTVSYHTKGEEIYWYFYQSLRTCPRDKGLALALSRSTGYPLAYAKNSAGGYKDWCISKRKIPAFTIEAGEEKDAHPITGEGTKRLIEKNLSSLYDLSKEF